MNALRRADWLTAARVRGYCTLFAASYALLTVAVLATAQGDMDAAGKPIGTDFSLVWAAGHAVLAGDPALPFDHMRFFALQRDIFGPGHGLYGWHYPPYFLAVAGALALLAYLPALLLWQATTFCAYLAAMRALAPRPALRPTFTLGAAALPAVIINLGHGQNGFLSAALLGGALLALPRRPWVAGTLFACLAFKPQFALAVPVALLFGRHWRALAALGATAVAMTLASLWAFGLASWLAFAGSLGFTRSVLEQGWAGWPRMQSAFALIRLWGGGVPLAYAAQTATSICALAVTALAWHRGAEWRVRAALLTTACLLVTPYSLDYDLMLIAPALATLAALGLERGFLPYEKTALAAIWLVPLLARLVAQSLALPLGFLSLVLLFGLAARHLLPARSGSAEAAPAPLAAALGQP